jgi:hypothetical protein
VGRGAPSHNPFPLSHVLVLRVLGLGLRAGGWAEVRLATTPSPFPTYFLRELGLGLRAGGWEEGRLTTTPFPFPHILSQRFFLAQSDLPKPFQFQVTLFFPR